MSPAINKCHMALEVSCRFMWQKEFPQRKEITLTSEYDYNDNREREQIGPACGLPQSLCSKLESQEQALFLKHLIKVKKAGHGVGNPG